MQVLRNDTKTQVIKEKLFQTYVNKGQIVAILAFVGPEGKTKDIMQLCISMYTKPKVCILI